MPVGGFPTSYEFLDYENKETLDGSSSSSFHFTCAISDLSTVRGIYLESVDSLDTNLACSGVTYRYLNNDGQTGMVDAHAEFIPVWKLNLLKPGQPFRVRINYTTQTFTIKSSAWTWLGNSKPVLTTSICPLKSVAIDEITLFGSRTGTSTNGSMNLTYLDGFRDKVNNDTFLGAPPGCIIFIGASANPRQLADGSLTNDIEIRVNRRAIPWNQFFDDAPGRGVFDEVRDPSGNPMFASTAFAGLFAL